MKTSTYSLCCGILIGIMVGTSLFSILLQQGCIHGDFVAYKNQPAQPAPRETSGDDEPGSVADTPPSAPLTIPALPPAGVTGKEWLAWLWDNKGIFLTDVMVLYTMIDRRKHGKALVKEIKNGAPA